MGSTDSFLKVEHWNQMANIHAQSNGAEQTPNAGSLKVVIVGAGIAGLTTAVALRQQGHEVHV